MECDIISIYIDILKIDIMECFCKNNQSTKQLFETVLFLKAISDENRLKIVCFLKEGEKCVCDIVNFLELPQNLVSHHLKVLRDQNILISRKDGSKVFYLINEKNISNIINFFDFLILKS
ncbi:MAG TPA: ArsR family transcriptional regulator [Bacteroidia bacterium]|nr:ArsR family transcriptional regulator [Bacteroidia bacterium]